MSSENWLVDDQFPRTFVGSLGKNAAVRGDMRGNRVDPGAYRREEREVQAATIVDTFMAIVERWEADEGVANSDEYRAAIRRRIHAKMAREVPACLLSATGTEQICGYLSGYLSMIVDAESFKNNWIWTICC